jgi:hypothetical protein
MRYAVAAFLIVVGLLVIANNTGALRAIVGMFAN